MKLRCMPYIRFHTLNFVLRLKNRPNPDFSTPNRENSPSQNNHAHLSPSSTGRVREFSNYAVDTRVLATTRNFWPISVERVKFLTNQSANFAFLREQRNASNFGRYQNVFMTCRTGMKMLETETGSRQSENTLQAVKTLSNSQAV